MLNIFTLINHQIDAADCEGRLEILCKVSECVQQWFQTVFKRETNANMVSMVGMIKMVNMDKGNMVNIFKLVNMVKLVRWTRVT